MAKGNNIIDGFSVKKWNEIETIAAQYPRPIRFSETVSSKIAILNFYLNELVPNGKPAYMTMEKGRMIAIAYMIYNNRDSDGVKELCLKLLRVLVG